MKNVITLNLIFICLINFQSSANHQLIDTKKNEKHSSNHVKANNSGKGKIARFKARRNKMNVSKMAMDHPKIESGVMLKKIVSNQYL